MISTNPTITQKEMAEQMGLTKDGVYYHVNKLRAKGVLLRIGGKKAGRWMVLINP